MPASNPSTTLYTLGRGKLSMGAWSGDTPPGALNDVGNCPSFEIEVTEETLEHYSSRSGTRLLDKSVVLETGYECVFELDEISISNLAMFLKGSVSGNVVSANVALTKEYAIEFISDNPAGPNETWQLHKAKLTPNGAFNLIGEDWSTLSFNAKGLADELNNPTSPFFTVTFHTTTTTTTT